MARVENSTTEACFQKIGQCSFVLQEDPMNNGLDMETEPEMFCTEMISEPKHYRKGWTYFLFRTALSFKFLVFIGAYFWLWVFLRN